MQFTDDFSVGGIALGTLVTIIGYHLVRWLAPAYMRQSLDQHKEFGEGTAIAVGRTGEHAALGEGVDSPPAPRHGSDDSQHTS